MVGLDISQYSNTNTKSTIPVKLGRIAKVRFNILAVGESGSGKKTFLKNLCNHYGGGSHNFPFDQLNIEDNFINLSDSIDIKQFDSFTLTSEGWDCEVHISQVLGYGDTDNKIAIDQIRKYLQRGHSEWSAFDGNLLTEKERNNLDSRIHCIFYFLRPHRMKKIDRIFLSEISSLACIIPIISKADCMTTSERRIYLHQVHTEIETMKKICSRDIVFDFRENLLFGEDVNISVGTDTNDDDILHPSRELLEERDGREKFEIDYSHAFLPIPHPPVNADMSMSYSTIMIQTQSSPIKYEASSPRLVKQLPMVSNVFAVICSSNDDDDEQDDILRRVYPWGHIDVEDETVSDFRRLQRLVFESDKISELRDKTQHLTMELAKKSPKTISHVIVSLGLSLLIAIVIACGKIFSGSTE